MLKNKIEELNNINYHDGDIINYKINNNNILFELKDGWLNDTYYKIELTNFSVQVMNNKSDLICYTLNKFNNINNNKLNLYSGECNKIDDKYYLKLWIRYPNDLNDEELQIMDKYQFEGLDVNLCNDQDDTGMVYIKFIADDINIHY